MDLRGLFQVISMPWYLINCAEKQEEVQFENLVLIQMYGIGEACGNLLNKQASELTEGLGSKAQVGKWLAY